MKQNPKLSLATALLAALGVALVFAQTNCPVTNSACCVSLANPAMLVSLTKTNTSATLPEKKGLPKLLDLGAGKCIPCKMMTPILEQLKKEYAGWLEVEFIDVWKNESAGEKHKINMIPTQIFFDVAGKELYRHEGFYAKEDILAKWKELGVDLKATK